MEGVNQIYKYPVVLSIAGSDCSGGAGVQADTKAISALGGYAATAITAITVQNTCGVSAIWPVPSDLVEGQIRAVMNDLHPVVVKIGMVVDVDIARTVAHCLRGYTGIVVYDPVMVSTSGHTLLEENAINIIKEELFPLCTLITPNLPEAQVLTGRHIDSLSDMYRAMEDLRRWGDYAVLLKGGHIRGGEMLTDLLLMPEMKEAVAFETPRIDSQNTHGTGCTLSSAIAALCAQGMPLTEAVFSAKNYVFECIRQGADVIIGEGHGPLNHFWKPKKMKKY